VHDDLDVGRLRPDCPYSDSRDASREKRCLDQGGGIGGGRN